MKRVEVDFGTTVRGGLIRANLRRFPGETTVRGETVEAFDDDEGLSFTGVVEEIDDRFAYLKMNWSDAAADNVQNTCSALNFFLSANALVVAGMSSANTSGPLQTLRPPLVDVPVLNRHLADA